MSIRRGVGLGCGLMLSVLLALLALALVGVVVDMLSVGDGGEAFDPKAEHSWPEAEYSWPVKWVVRNGNPVLAVDAGADHPAGLSSPLWVCVRGVIMVAPGVMYNEVIVGDPVIRFRNVARVGPGCTCQAVADVFVNGRSLARTLFDESGTDRCEYYWQDSCRCKGF